MEIVTLGLAAIAAASSIASLIVVLRLRRDVHKLRMKNVTSEKVFFDSSGVWCTKAEDVQRYRDSIQAPTLDALPNP